MGVRGLTTYITQNADYFLDAFELHDCKVIIDGDSLSSNLYCWVSNCNSAFGGNYDQFFRIVCAFFEMLKQCNVTPYVLMDGGYKPKKLRTVRQRLRSKIGAIKHLNPFDCKPMFPIMMREVFVNALEHCGVNLMRCPFEADDEVAALARKLKCPVLSYDSDFFIHNVMYIPLNTLELVVYRRNIPNQKLKNSSKRKELVSKIAQNGEYQKFKLKKVNEDLNATEKTSYYFMQCSMYRIYNLTRKNRIKSNMLPLFATLLGNDYVSSSIFRKFYANVSLKQTGKRNSQQAKRIVALLRWLQHETLESAVNRIIGHVEKEKKEWLLRQIEIAIDGYRCEKSVAYDYFQLSPSADRVNATIELQSEENTLGPILTSEEDGCEEECSEELKNSDEEINEDSEQDELCSNGTSDSDTVSEKDNTEVDDFEAFDSFVPPEWLHMKMLPARLPRYIMDLLTLRLYINAPQVENFQLSDANLIAVPILRMIFTILHTPKKSEFRYLTRVQRMTNIEYKKFESLDQVIPFDVNKSDNYETFKMAFDGFEQQSEIFKMVENNLPDELQMFALSLIYWSKHSQHFNVVYVNSLIICFIMLSVIDAQLGPIRRQDELNKTYAPELVKTAAKKKPVESNQQSLSIKDRINSIGKDECILALDNLLHLFDVSDKLRTKHTVFSSDILHGFAEFQAIVYQLNCLSIFCAERIFCLKIADFFNGCFLYNLYVTLKERPDIGYYIQHFLFPLSPNIGALIDDLLALLQPFIKCLSVQTISKRRKNRNIKKKKLREARKADAKTTVNEDETPADEERHSSEFEDMNNKFACLRT